MNTLFDQLNKALEKEFLNNLEYKYFDPFQDSDLYEIQINNIIDQTRQGYPVDPVYFSWFLDLFIYHFEYSVFSIIDSNEKDQTSKHLAIANKYGFICLDGGSKCCGEIENGSPFIIVNKATFMLATLLLSHEEKNHSIIGKHLIDSLNGENCIIKKGYAKSTISWFVLKLYSLQDNKEIKLHKLLQPKAGTLYEDILENWETTNSTDVEKYIELLCESHIAQAHLDYEQTLDEEYGSLTYKELFSPSLYLFPFEILYWLKLREIKGLKNPKKYSHPLMNTPIAKFFLNLKTPLEKPKDLPYAKELLTKLKEKCPGIEVPDWL